MNYNYILQFDSVGYFIEIFLAELLFLHAYKRKKYFWGRIISGVLTIIFILTHVNLPEMMMPISVFTWFFIVIALSVLLVLFCYQGDSFSIVSTCVAGLATQHIAYKLIKLIVLKPEFYKIYTVSPLNRVITEVVVSAIVYFLVYMIFARQHVPGKSSIQINLLSLVIVITCIGINRLVEDQDNMSINYGIAVCLYAIISCFFALTIQFYLYKWQQEKTEKLVINRLLSASEKQYEQWKAMVEFTNIKTHDLRHMLDRIEMIADKDEVKIPDLSSIRDSINNFSPLVKTGNDVLDVLLRNMERICRQNDVRFNCVSYTNRLGALDSMSLYFLFANAIDNARAGAMTVSDKDKRIVDVSLKQFGNSVIIHIWNYYDGVIDYENEMPVRQDNVEGHGFGLKSIKMIVDKFEGVMKAYSEEDVFHLNIIIPL